MGTGNLKNKEITVVKRYIEQKEDGIHTKEIWKTPIFYTEIIAIFLTIYSICNIFTTAFAIAFNNSILYIAILFYSIWFVFYFQNDFLVKKRWMFFAVIWFSFIGILIFLWNPLVGGGAELVNQVINRINRTYNGQIGYIETKSGSITFALCIILFVITWFITKGIVERRDSYHLLFVGFPILVCSLLSGGTINVETMFILFLCIQLILVITALRKRSAFWGGKGTTQYLINRIIDGKIRFKMLLIMGSLVIVLSCISFYFLGRQIEEPINRISDNTVTIKAKGLRFLQDILPKISGGKLSFSIDGVGGGISGGVLGELEGTYYGKQETLKITCTKLPTETMYLKGFVGTTYEGNRWKERDGERFLDVVSNWEIEEKPELYIQNLPFLRMMYAMNSEVMEGEKYEPAYLTIEYMGENRNYTYLPYNTYLDEYYNIGTGDGSVNPQTHYDNIFPLFEKAQFENIMEEWNKKDDLHGVLDDVEVSYKYYVIGQDTQTGSVDFSELEKLCVDKKKEWDDKFKSGMTDEQIDDLTKEKYEDIKNFVRRTLLERCKFEDKATKIPEGKDFINYFMFERKNTAVLHDHNAHEWAEIYVPGMGYTYVETTPGFDGTLTNLEMPKEDEKESENVEENEEEQDKEVTKEKKGFLEEMLTELSKGISERLVQIIVISLMLLCFMIFRYIWLFRNRRGLIKGYSEKEIIKNVFYNFYELLVFAGFDKDIDVTTKEFVDEVANNYMQVDELKVDKHHKINCCFESEMISMEKYMGVVLNAHYGFEKASKTDVEYSRKMYEKLSMSVYGQISIWKKCVFKLWKAY